MRVPGPIRECGLCGAELPPEARFCAGCGSRVGGARPETSWDVSDRRTFGVLPGRRFFRAARTRLVRLRAVVLGRLRFGREALAALASARLELFRLSREAAGLARRRARKVYELGEAVYRGDEAGAERARAEVSELDSSLAATAERARACRRRLEARIGRARHEGGRTEVVPPEPSGPVVVPEPGYPGR